MWKWIIYALVDPRNGNIRYVGKSSSGIKRAKEHAKPSHWIGKDHPRARWISGLMAIGHRYEIRVLEEVPHSSLLNEYEKWWIACGRAHGWSLTNIAPGGEGGQLTDSTRKKISRRLAGHSVSLSTRAAVAASNRARKPYTRTEEMRQASRKRQSGKTLSEPHLKNLRAATARRVELKRANLNAQSVRVGQGE